MGAGLVLQANGQVKPTPDAYKKMLYEKGQSAAPGDRVIVTALDIKSDRIIIDFNGGPYAKHRFLRHIELNGSSMPMAGDPAEVATGSRITLVFEGGVPEVSGPEVKALLQPLVDFGVKSSEQAYAETLPPVLKEAIAAHEVLVGMNHRMVLAALGPPENKMREQQSGDPNGGKYEEWIYGHVPQTIRFVRFIGDRVTVVEIAELGKPIVIHDKDEMAGYNAPPNTREVALGDQQQPKQGEDPGRQAPSLRMPGEPHLQTDRTKFSFRTGTRKRRWLQFRRLRRTQCPCLHRLQLPPLAERLQCQTPPPSRNNRLSCKLVEEPRSQSFSSRFPPVSPGRSLREVQDDSNLRALWGEQFDPNIPRVSRNFCTRESKHYG